MAHPCFLCGSECYCQGDIDDVIVLKTPTGGCRGCGCRDFDDYTDDIDDREYFIPCDDCDLPDACEDFGCARNQGLLE